jgi:hypothetical protein
MAETSAQIEAALVKIREQIDRVILVQSYSLGGRQHVNQSLKELRAQEKSLVLRLHRMTKGAAVLSDFSGAGDY